MNPPSVVYRAYSADVHWKALHVVGQPINFLLESTRPLRRAPELDPLVQCLSVGHFMAVGAALVLEPIVGPSPAVQPEVQHDSSGPLPWQQGCS